MKRFFAPPWLTFLLTALFLAACRRHGPDPQSPTAVDPTAPVPTSTSPTTATPTNQRLFQVKGVVREVVPEKNSVRIAHEEIPGFMAAMTMPFDVKDPKELDGLAPGDTVAFRMIVTPAEGWIEQIVKLTQTSTSAPPVRPSFRVVREVEPLALGDRVPDYHFTNHLGRPVSLHDFRGQALAITFFYTRCLYPNFCPRMSANFAAAQEKLMAMTRSPTNWQLLSITFDPEFDSPNVLAGYAHQYRPNPAHWQFLSGALLDVTALAEQVRMFFWRSDPAQPVAIDHNLVTIVLDPNGRLHTLITGNEWKVDHLVSEIVKAARLPASGR